MPNHQANAKRWCMRSSQASRGQKNEEKTSIFKACQPCCTQKKPSRKPATLPTVPLRRPFLPWLSPNASKQSEWGNAMPQEIRSGKEERMFPEPEECCELWEEVPPMPILHSRLCDLEPVGVGSPMVESLTSYVTRLADAHSVSPITLVTNEILPRVNPPQMLQENRSVYAQVSSVLRESALLNGVAGGTQSWVLALVLQL